MFSQWATKRVCKFFMKRLLGRILRSELDLEQLDVQLGSGKIQLKDLALNTDYLNDQLGETSLVIKEGLVGSITAKIPWKVLAAEACEIEVNDLELVVFPRVAAYHATCGGGETWGKTCINKELQPQDPHHHFSLSKGEGDLCGTGGGGCGGAYVGVDDGVRMIAKMVERVLSGLRVKVTNLTIRWTCCTAPPQSIMVARVAYVEYGVEGPDEQLDGTLHSSATNGEEESTMFVKVIKFKGVTMEFVDELDGDGQQSERLTVDLEPGGAPVVGNGVVVDKRFLGYAIPFLMGDHGHGVAGSIQLGMPWHDGTLDVPKINAEFFISPLKVRASACKIQQLFLLIESFSNWGGNVEGIIGAGSGKPICQNSTSMAELWGSVQAIGPRMLDRTGGEEMSPAAIPLTRLGGREMESDLGSKTFLPVTRFISDWMHWAGSDSQRREGAVAEADLAASVDEFFECFDGTRSQVGASSSGLWNWTCSAFSAITAASTLAAGSVILSPDPRRQVEYSVKARLVRISIELVFEGSLSAKAGASVDNSSPMDGSLDLCGQRCPDGWAFDDLDLRVELDKDEVTADCETAGMLTAMERIDEYLEVQLAELNISVVVSLEAFKNNVLRNLRKWQLPMTSRCRGAVNGSGDDGGSCVNIVALLCPVIVWLDVCTLKRIENSFSQIRFPVRPKEITPRELSNGGKKAAVAADIDQVIDLDMQQREGNGSVDLDRRGFLRASLSIPCVRVIVCFPSDGRQCSTKLHKEFITIDFTIPALQPGVTQPTVVFKYANEFKTVLGAQAGHSLLLNLEGATMFMISTPNADKFHAVRVLSISQQASSFGGFSGPNEVANEGASCEFQWHSMTQTPSWIAQRAWDRAASQQRRGDGGGGIGGSSSEYAAATATEAVEEENLHIREEIIGCSRLVVHINLPMVGIQLSRAQHIQLLKGFSCFMAIFNAKLTGKGSREDKRNRTEPSGQSPSMLGVLPGACQTSQISVLVQCGQVDVLLDLKPLQASDLLSASATEESKGWDFLHFLICKLQVLSVLGLGGSADASYLWLHHDECQVMGSLPFSKFMPLNGEKELLLLSCRSHTLGRGDGGRRNALATGSAGLTITYIIWPHLESFANVLFTGNLRGATFVANGGRLDWISAVWAFFSPLEESESVNRYDSVAGTAHDTVETCELESKTAAKLAEERASMQKCFVMDLHDVALCYEPGMEAMLVPAVRTGRPSQVQTGVMGGAPTYDQLGSGAPCGPSSGSLQMFAPVACVLAAAAVRVSTGEASDARGEQYNVWLRDVALHLLDTVMRKQALFNYTTDCMHRTGYVQVAKEAVMEAFVTIQFEEGLSWEVECANNQLRFDTCHDSAAAFGRLIAQLQALCAPNVEQSVVQFTPRRPGGGSPHDSDSSGYISTNNSDACSEPSRDSWKQGAVDKSGSNSLLDGVLENAFTRTRGGGVIAGHTVVVDTGVTSLGRWGNLERSHSEPLTPRSESRASGEESVDIQSPCNISSGLPVFIEDYYVSGQPHVSHSCELLHSRQDWDSSRPATLHAKNFKEGSTAGGLQGDVDGRGGWYDESSFKIVDNHVPEENQRVADVPVDRQQSGQNWHHLGRGQIPKRKTSLPRKYPQPVGRVVLQDLSARWHLYGGSDWPSVEKLPKANAGLASVERGRQLGVCLEVLLDGVDLQYYMFPTNGLYSSRLFVSVRDIGVYDCSTDAPWKMVLGYHRTASQPRESSSQAMKIEMDAVRPDPVAPLEEYRLFLALLPIRLHLDQHHIDFCINFFSPRAGPIVPPHSGLVDDSLYPSAGSSINSVPSFESGNPDTANDAFLPYFQICELQPLSIRLDYLPRHIDLMALREGNYAELLNLVSWKGIELHLKHIRAAGVHGWSSLSGIIFGEWLEDISQNQIHKFVQGVGPIRPLYAVGSGAAKLLVLPAEHYHKDRRLLRGMRKGAFAFVRSISLEALSLGAHLAAGAHEILQHAEVALGGSPIQPLYSIDRGELRSRPPQPADTREGFQQACESMSQGLERTASSLLGNPLKVYQRGAGAGLAVASALWAAPAAAVAPASAAAVAVQRALLGVRNGLDPEHKWESDQKHTGPLPDVRRNW
ncbi:unnamed protein product [Sphagnum tenellum]